MVEGWGGMWRQRREQSSIEARKWQLGKVDSKYARCFVYRGNHPRHYVIYFLYS
jgi:hypothetical protein